jgi:hypothetical protein
MPEQKLTRDEVIAALAADRKATREQLDRAILATLKAHPECPDYKIAAANNVGRTKVWTLRMQSDIRRATTPLRSTADLEARDELIAADLRAGKKHSLIAMTRHCSLSRINEVAKKNDLQRR